MGHKNYIINRDVFCIYVSIATTNPGSRKPTSISELPSSYSSVSKEPFHSSPFSPPPRPPKPKPEPSIVPPSLPPKAKIEAPALPPKPVKTTQRG